MSKIEGGDTLLFPSGQCTLEQLLNNNTSWTNGNSNLEGGETDE